MIIDAHSHIEPLAELKDFPAASYGMPKSDIEQYLAHYSQNNVDACFTFMGHGLRQESCMKKSNEELARLRDMHPERIYPWATVCPSWPEKEIRREIRHCVRDLGLLGLKFVPIVQGYPLSAKGMDIVAEEAIALNIPVTIHDGSPEYCSAIQVVSYARKFPGLRVLSAHSGLRELWPDFIDGVKELPNLWLCLSGPTQHGIQTLYDRLGPDRLLFGSDGGLGHHAVITAYLRRINALNAPEKDKTMILGQNAARFLGIDS